MISWSKTIICLNKCKHEEKNKASNLDNSFDRAKTRSERGKCNIGMRKRSCWGGSEKSNKKIYRRSKWIRNSITYNKRSYKPSVISDIHILLSFSRRLNTATTLYHVPDRQGYTLKTAILVALAIEGPSYPMSPLIPRLISENIAAPILKLQQVLFALIVNIHKSKVFFASQWQSCDDRSKSHDILNMHP